MIDSEIVLESAFTSTPTVAAAATGTTQMVARSESGNTVLIMLAVIIVLVLLTATVYALQSHHKNHAGIHVGPHGNDREGLAA